jgi:hypothetical protein
MASEGVAAVVAATRAYERWFRKHLDVVEADLTLKHNLMRDSVFVFLRGTFYRWAALWQEGCPRPCQGAKSARRGRFACGEFRHLA